MTNRVLLLLLILFDIFGTCKAGITDVLSFHLLCNDLFDCDLINSRIISSLTLACGVCNACVCIVIIHSLR